MNEIKPLIAREWQRQNSSLEMIASENFTYPDVLEAAGSVLTNKYAEGYAGRRYYGGCEVVDEIERIAISRACKLFGAKYANVQPHSGSQANQAAFAALVAPGARVLGMSLDAGGHLTHGSKVNASGKMYESFGYGVGADGLIDYDAVAALAEQIRPALIVCGASAYARVINFAKFRAIADAVGAYLLADIAHIAGLVATGLHPSPLPHAHVVTSTTHKTLRGPRGGLILCNDEGIAKKIDSAVFPNLQGGPLMHIIAAKAVGFAHNAAPEYAEYMQRTKDSCAALAETLLARGYELVSGGTDNHLLLMDFKRLNFSGRDAQFALEAAGITANKNSVPNEPRSPFITSGLRLGTAALCARGLGAPELREVGEIIADILDALRAQMAANPGFALNSPADFSQIAAPFAARTAAIAGKFPLYAELAAEYADCAQNPAQIPAPSENPLFSQTAANTDRKGFSC